MSRLTEEQWQAISIGTTVASSLSIICAIITIVTYLKWRRFHTSVSDLVFMMAISELISMSGYVIGRKGPAAGVDSVLCQLQGALEQVGDISSIMWTSFIALDLMLIIFFQRAVEQVNRLHYRVYAPVCALVALSVGLVPLGLRDAQGNRFYGDSSLWCWISQPWVNYQLYVFYLPLWLVFIFNATVYALVGRILWKHFKQASLFGSRTGLNNFTLTYAKNVSLYLAAFLLTWTAPSINRLYTYLRPNDQVFALYLLHATLPTANGIFNSIIYFYIAWISGIVSTRDRKEDTTHLTRTNAVPLSPSKATALGTGSFADDQSIPLHTYVSAQRSTPGIPASSIDLVSTKPPRACLSVGRMATGSTGAGSDLERQATAASGTRVGAKPTSILESPSSALESGHYVHPTRAQQRSVEVDTATQASQSSSRIPTAHLYGERSTLGMQPNDGASSQVYHYRGHDLLA
ncbi:hypothetical protein THASP1DRAFT_29219 [Thamnocephalis sphaerospora]|uniref:G-protein coupled receptors family 2 profile 2 domain-containing protein n=1 Tax=Thamnocephalis sphaerospora TaxID=78915 RepID=A0A4P9XTV3_9FUNG|nr:hypothetical protein THASP1DRAFT_29219 [Thamnocephalis sphaerospora]|eukprot:RKP08991.1 hypothetical protein THASP1DRAFT_29219 [Thamnocephalis sphaerospora]